MHKTPSKAAASRSMVSVTLAGLSLSREAQTPKGRQMVSKKHANIILRPSQWCWDQCLFPTLTLHGSSHNDITERTWGKTQQEHCCYVWPHIHGYRVSLRFRLCGYSWCNKFIKWNLFFFKIILILHSLKASLKKSNYLHPAAQIGRFTVMGNLWV